MQSFEKRHFIRARADFPVTIELLGKTEAHYPSQALDISIDGIHLCSEVDLPLETALVLYFPENWGGICVIAKAVRRIGNSYGCRFLDMQPSARKMLDTTVYRYWRQNVHRVFP